MKKINERFDDYMQKYFHEDTPLEDILSGEQMVGSNDIGRFFKKLFWDFKPLSDCVHASTSQKFFKMQDDVFTFIFRNNEFHLSVSFDFIGINSSRTNGRCDFCVFYQPVDYDGEMAVDLFSPGECIHIGDFEDKNLEQTCKVLKDTFEVLLKKLGFTKEYNSIQEWRKIRAN